MPADLLRGKTALVTGASRGIGAAVAECFAQQGASLLLAARSVDKLEEVAQRCREAGAPSCEVLRLDLSDPRSIQELAEKVLGRPGGPPQVLVNNAGVSEGGSDLLTGDPAGWEFTVDVDLAAPMRLTRLLAPSMVERGEGVIINVGSLAGTQPMSRDAHYAAAKWGVRGWVLSTYEELRKHGVKTMVIEPGFVATDMVLHQEGLLPERMIKPEDVAQTALLPFRMSAVALPVEVVLRVGRSVYKL